jgi:parallel beta-helix repeat protein
MNLTYSQVTNALTLEVGSTLSTLAGTYSYLIMHPLGDNAITAAKNGTTGGWQWSTNATYMINYASARGSTFVAGGWYYTDKALVLHSNYPLIGAGRNFTYIQQNAGVVANGVEAVNQVNVRLEGFTFISTTAQNGSAGVPDELKQNGASIRNCRGGLIQFNDFYGFGWNGIQLYGGSSSVPYTFDITVQNNGVYNVGWHSIELWRGVSRCHILNNNITNKAVPPVSAMPIEGGTFNIVSGNYLSGIYTGIDLSTYTYGAVTQNMITQNTIIDATIAGIYIRDGSENLISENTISQPTSNGPGIYQTGANSNDNRILHNLIEVAGNGFYSDGGISAYIISENTFRGTYAYNKECIHIAGTSAGNQTALITNNHFYDNYYMVRLSGAGVKNTVVLGNTGETIWTGGMCTDSSTNAQWFLNYVNSRMYGVGASQLPA